MNNSWNPFSYPPRAVAKAVYGFLLPGVVAIGAAYARAANDSARPVTKFDFIAALVAMFVTGGVVFGANNRDSGDNGEVGGVGVWFVVGALLIALGILGLLGVVALSTVVSVILCIAGVVLLVLDRR